MLRVFRILTCQFGCLFRGTPLRAAWVAGIFPAILILVVACAGSQSFFTGSNDVSHQFEAGEVLAGHRYYSGGPDLKPNAIVAIDPAYALESPHWRPLEVTPESLKQLVDRIRFVPYAEYKTSPNGARIFAPDGRQIGVWYSVFDYTQVQLLDDRRVYLADPVSRLPSDVRIRIRGKKD